MDEPVTDTTVTDEPVPDVSHPFLQPSGRRVTEEMVRAVAALRRPTLHSVLPHHPHEFQTEAYYLAIAGQQVVLLADALFHVDECSYYLYAFYHTSTSLLRHLSDVQRRLYPQENDDYLHLALKDCAFARRRLYSVLLPHPTSCVVNGVPLLVGAPPLNGEDRRSAVYQFDTLLSVVLHTLSDGIHLNYLTDQDQAILLPLSLVRQLYRLMEPLVALSNTSGIWDLAKALLSCPTRGVDPFESYMRNRYDSALRELGSATRRLGHYLDTVAAMRCAAANGDDSLDTFPYTPHRPATQQGGS